MTYNFQPRIVIMPPKAKEKIYWAINSLLSFFLPEPFRTVLPYTMVGLKRLKNLDRLVHKIDELEIEGDIVECGTYNGGTAAILAKVATESRLKRHVWLVDSFRGFPEPTLKDGPYSKEHTGSCQGSKEKVLEVLRKSGVDDKKVTILEGWFKDTVPTLPVKKISLLHIDADFYESVKICLDYLFKKVEKGGFVVLDDYGYWEGYRLAFNEFKELNKLDITSHKVDNTGVFFQKT